MRKDLRTRLVLWAGIVVLVLTVPLFGGWPWTAGDFIVAAILLFGAAAAYEFAARKATGWRRIAIGVGVFLALAAVWGALAMG